MKNGELDRLKKIADLVDAMAEGLEKDNSEDRAEEELVESYNYINADEDPYKNALETINASVDSRIGTAWRDVEGTPIPTKEFIKRVLDRAPDVRTLLYGFVPDGHEFAYKLQKYLPAEYRADRSDLFMSNFACRFDVTGIVVPQGAYLAAPSITLTETSVEDYISDPAMILEVRTVLNIIRILVDWYNNREALAAQSKAADRAQRLADNDEKFIEDKEEKIARAKTLSAQYLEGDDTVNLYYAVGWLAGVLNFLSGKAGYIRATIPLKLDKKNQKRSKPVVWFTKRFGILPEETDDTAVPVRAVIPEYHGEYTDHWGSSLTLKVPPKAARVAPEFLLRTIDAYARPIHERESNSGLTGVLKPDGQISNFGFVSLLYFDYGFKFGDAPDCAPTIQQLLSLVGNGDPTDRVVRGYKDGALAVGEVVTDEDIFGNADADANPFELSWEDPSDEPLVTDLRNRKQD